MGKKFNRFLFSMLEFFLASASLFLFIFILLPIGTFLFILFYTWRLILVGYAKIFKDYIQIMGGKNPVMGIDNLYTRPLSTIVGMGAFDGRLDFQTASSFVQNVVCAKDPQNNSVYLNPEFFQYYEEWRGFLWWKWEKDFRIENHVKLWDNSSTFNNDKSVCNNNENSYYATEKTLIKIMHHLEVMPFTKERSPWEVIVLTNLMLENVSDSHLPKTAIIFRFHHGLADGIAMMQLFMKYIFDDTFEKIKSPSYVKRKKLSKIIFNIKSTLSMPYDFFKQGLLAHDVNEWHLAENELTREVFKGMTYRIPIKYIKNAKNELNVGFTAVLISVISGAIREIMIENGVKVPHKMHAILPLPWPGHPKKLCNHWSYGFIPLPISTPCPLTRLKKSHKYVETLKKSPSPYINFALLSLFNLLPTYIISSLTLTNYFPTVILSNFPGPPPGTQGINNEKLLDTCFTGGTLRGNIGISLTILSYDEGLRIVVGIDKGIAKTEEMGRRFVRAIEKGFENLDGICGDMKQSV